MKKFFALVLAGLVIAALMASILPAAPVAAKVGTLSLLDIRYNPDKGLVVLFNVNNGVLGPRNLHATMTIGDKTYDLSCIYKKEVAIVACMATQKLLGGERATINIDGQTFIFIVPAVTVAKTGSLPAACPAGQVPGYTATITGTMGGMPRSATQTATQADVDSFGGTGAWHDSLVDLYVVEMEWSDVSVDIVAGCINAPM
jgi:hypothetical protein